MVIVPLLILVALIIIPFFIRFLALVWRLIDQGTEAVFHPKSDLTTYQTSHKRKRIFWLVPGIYISLLLADLIWIVSFIIPHIFNNANEDSKILTFMIIFFILILIPFIIYVKRIFNNSQEQTNRVISMVGSRPDSSGPELFHWQAQFYKTYFNDIFKDQGRSVLRNYLRSILLGIVVVFGALIVAGLISQIYK
jgi:hypothetical protein